MNQPFLEVITRTFVGRRPDLLLRCHQSVSRLGEGVQHTVLVDPAPFGVPAANRKLATVEAQGQWVWVLDDDDVCCEPRLVEFLLWMAETRCPDAIIVKNRWSGADRVLPDDSIWGRRPKVGQIGTSCIITRGDVWNEYRGGWGERYEGDFDYIDGLFEAERMNISWLDVVAAEIPVVNGGRAG